MSSYDVDYLKYHGIPFSSLYMSQELDDILRLPWEELKEILIKSDYYIFDKYDYDSKCLKEILKERILPILNNAQIDFLLSNYAYRKVDNSPCTFRAIDNANGLVHGVINCCNSPRDWPPCLYEKDYMAIMNKTELEWDSFVAYLDNLDDSRVAELLSLDLHVIQLKQLSYSCKDSFIHSIIDKKLCSYENNDDNYNDDNGSSKIKDYIYWSIKMDICKDIHVHFTKGGTVESLIHYKKERELGLVFINTKDKRKYAFEYMRDIDFSPIFIEQLSFDEIKHHIRTRKCNDYFNLQYLSLKHTHTEQKIKSIEHKCNIIEKNQIHQKKIIYTLFFISVTLAFLI